MSDTTIDQPLDTGDEEAPQRSWYGVWLPRLAVGTILVAAFWFGSIWVFSSTTDFLLTLILSGFIALALLPGVERLTKRGWKRGAAAGFVMLIFFLIAGTVAPPLEPDLQLVDTKGLEGREPPDALVLSKDGTLSFRGTPTDPASFMDGHLEGPVRIVPDRNVPAPRLIEVTGALRRLGASSVFLVTEQVLE